MTKHLLKLLIAAGLSTLASAASAQSISITSTADTICSGSSVHFSASASGVGTPHYQWLKNSVNVGTDSFGYTTTSLSNGDVIMCVLSATAGGAAVAFSNPKVETVYSLPGSVTVSGASTVCRTATTTLTASATGGSWVSSTGGVANINALTGVVTGVNGGTANISYTITNLCGSITGTHLMTVNTTPNVPNIQGPGNICVGGAAATLTDSVTGGTWSSSNTTVATVSSTGDVTPIAVGSTTITYAVTNACGTTNRTRNINVIAAPVASPINGRLTVCEGDTAQLRSAPGGAWSSSDGTIATVAISGGGGPGGGMPFGLVTGINGGTATVSYVTTNACGSYTNTATVSVNPLPLVYPITGADSICQGSAQTFGQAATGGVWSSSNTGVATVTSAGVVTGVASGSAIITYSSTNDCGTSIQTKAVYISCPYNVGLPVVSNEQIVIAPNPATDIISVQGYVPSAIAVTNTLGQTLLYTTASTSIGVRELPAGIYIIRLYDSNGNVAATQRIVKE